MQTFSLRSEILHAAHRWQLILFWILLGSLLGWGYIQLRPPLIQAEAQLYVALNPYRAPEDANAAGFANFEFLNADDYKNWQLSQLNALALSDGYLQETLDRLRAQSPEWQGFTPADLRQQLSLEWRNTGDWHFKARGEQPELLSALAQTWAAVTAEKVQASIRASQQVLFTDIQLQTLAQAQTDLMLRQEILLNTQDSLAAWQQSAQALPTAEPLPQTSLQQLRALLSQVYPDEQARESLGLSFPAETSPAPEHLALAAQLTAHVNLELKLLETQGADLAAEIEAQRSLYTQAAGASWGFAPSLVLDNLSNQPPLVTSDRPAAPAALAGGLLGLIAWAVYALWQAARSSTPTSDESQAAI